MRARGAVLLIDSDPGVAQILREALAGDPGLELHVAEPGRAVEPVIRSRWSLILLDLNGPLGQDARMRRWAIGRPAGSTLVITTPYRSIEDLAALLASGPLEFLPKPFSPEQVRDLAQRMRLGASPEE
jgi:NtrC-family two-component system response regulator AlgB